MVSGDALKHVRGQALDQGLAAWIHQINEERRVPLYEALAKLQASLDTQDRAFARALGELDWVRERIGSPENILGSARTKHGEIAEIAEVGLRRAREALEGRPPTAFWEEVPRLAPEDYIIAGEPVQSKFVNGINNALSHLLEHSERHPTFATADGGYYHIPRDQHAMIERILNGDTGELAPRTVRAITAKIEEIERVNGRPFFDQVRPASNDYAGVQQGRINATMDRHQEQLEADHESMKEGVVDEHRDEVETAQRQAAPNLGELGKVTATGAAVGAGLQLTVGLYQKWKREGKRPTQLTVDDWKELGGSTLSGAAVGGVSAAALYGLTNYSALSAPFAGAVVSSGRAMATLVGQYKRGEISFDEFTDLSLISTTEAGIAAAGAALGQVIIPIPVVGALIGSTVARLASEHAKNMLRDQADEFSAKLRAEFESQIASLDATHRKLLSELEAQMLRLGDLTTAAFDRRINAELLLFSSVRLAEAHGVSPKEIIRTIQDVDGYILGHG